MFKDKLFNRLTKHLFNTIDIDDVLRSDTTGKVYLRGKQIDIGQLAALIENAKAFKTSGLWKLMQNEAKYAAKKIIYDETKTLEDARFGKAMLLNLEVLENFLERLSKLK
jgi:predicted lipoprotein